MGCRRSESPGEAEDLERERDWDQFSALPVLSLDSVGGGAGGEEPIVGGGAGGGHAVSLPQEPRDPQTSLRTQSRIQLSSRWDLHQADACVCTGMDPRQDASTGAPWHRGPPASEDARRGRRDDLPQTPGPVRVSPSSTSALSLTAACIRNKFDERLPTSVVFPFKKLCRLESLDISDCGLRELPSSLRVERHRVRDASTDVACLQSSWST